MINGDPMTMTDEEMIRVKFCEEINRLNRENEACRNRLAMSETIINTFRANQILGRCGDCKHTWENGFVCKIDVSDFWEHVETIPTGYCHRWEARENE